MLLLRWDGYGWSAMYFPFCSPLRLRFPYKIFFFLLSILVFYTHAFMTWLDWTASRPYSYRYGHAAFFSIFYKCRTPISVYVLCTPISPSAMWCRQLTHLTCTHARRGLVCQIFHFLRSLVCRFSYYTPCNLKLI